MALMQVYVTHVLGAIHGTSELDRSEIDLSPKRSESVNAQMRTEIDSRSI